MAKSHLFDILNTDDQKKFNQPPVLSPEDQKHCFQIPENLKQTFKTLGTPSHQVCFVLLCGYYQASGHFFNPTDFRKDDIQIVCKQLAVSQRDVSFKTYKRRTLHYHKQLICQHLAIKLFESSDAQKALQDLLLDRVSRHQSPPKILQEIVQIFRSRRIEIPNYNRLVIAITQAVNGFEQKLTDTINLQTSESQKEKLEQLLTIEKTDTSLIVRLKTIDHSKEPRHIQQSVKELQILQKLYQDCLSLINALDLHADTVKHYAAWVRKASLSQIKQLTDNKRHLSLLCFIIHNYRLRQDILVDIFLSSIQSAHNSVTAEQKNHALRQTEIQKETLTVLSTVRISYKAFLIQIEEISASTILNDTEKIKQINDVLQAYHQQTQPLEEEANTKLEQVKKEERTYYDILIKQSVKLQNRVAEILRHLSFETDVLVATPIGLAVQYYQKKEGRIGKRSPIAFLSEAEKIEIKSRQIQKKSWKSLYKALLYIHVADALKAGTLSPFPAYRYLSLEYYLYPKEQWLIHKTRLLEECGLTDFQDCAATLNVLGETLHASYERTNQHILSGENQFVKFDSKGKIIVTTPKVEKIDTQPVSVLLKENKDVSILQILSDIQAYTDYLSCFRHHSVKEQKITPQPELLYAAILSLGCNIGVPKMAHVSKGISEDSLANVVNWHISIENIRAVNQKILDFIDKLSLSSLYRKQGNKLHTSSDGRTVVVCVESTNANRSFKYFGNGIGTTVYSFVDNLNRLFYVTAISSAERDAAYVVDGLLNNLAVKSSIHSTDTHGYSEILFGVLHFLGIYFGPPFRNVRNAKTK